ncbi:MAG: 4Fe-4S dicluster domain-containing protein [Chloroflexi bacterium]|nr:4Fe-4S dicluster domain-containing protein [Chloroflexota bacterium]
MSKYAMLIDETRCTGCRACQIACKQWNDLPAEKTHNRGSYQNPPALSAQTWNLIEFREIQAGDKVGFYFLKRACMHCEHPACASVCPVGALHKTAEGPVIYDESKCIGCRYCMAACPFGIPTFDWSKGVLGQPVIHKCNFCIDRVSNGLLPACAKACPSRVIAFGEREQLLAHGEARIRQYPERYTSRVYGKEEAGGTSVLYLSSIPFEQLGLPQVSSTPAPTLSEQVMHYTVPFAAAWGATLTGLALLFRFRKRGEERAREKSDSKGEA